MAIVANLTTFIRPRDSLDSEPGQEDAAGQEDPALATRLFVGYTLKRVVDVYVSQVAATVSPEPATESKEGSNDVKNKK
ncbi:uncharacterized protein H6S33_012953 [Morchella sextelata]|uniref:uncharacterized protein n=1 Tax=Morchella sextelata TaxID=1174677 RepID=UPI001D04E67B|nr:uncharacterized protein H6S33_012953 [Morchella sextelata]KAH0609467.1 hypothetical protein H6S33_012953 [Morchella sextelata]